MNTFEQKRRKILKQGSLTLTALALPKPLISLQKLNFMNNNKTYDVIIIGGSYAGLSAAMALGRALRNILIIDSGLPCNRQTPHSHNLITQDGEKPHIIAEKARSQVKQYSTVKFINDIAVSSKKSNETFVISTKLNGNFNAKKIIFATGVKDIMPNISGFSECWGISIVHCPYCHGYEIKNKQTGILANGDFAYHYAQLIRNWTKKLTIFTNGKSTLTKEQTDKINKYNIQIIEKEIYSINNQEGRLDKIIFNDNSSFPLEAIYSRPDFEQHCNIPEKLGCEINQQGHLVTDMFGETSIKNVFACGDNSSPMRSVANSIATGNLVGAVVNNKMTEEEFI